MDKPTPTAQLKNHIRMEINKLYMTMSVHKNNVHISSVQLMVDTKKCYCSHIILNSNVSIEIKKTNIYKFYLKKKHLGGSFEKL